MSLNRKCKLCGKSFHRCNSCNILYNWEYDYCSEDCWLNSSEYNKDIELFKEFCWQFTPEQKKIFVALYDGNFFDGDYDVDIQKTLKDLPV